MSNYISIIIANFNGEEYLDRCLNSLKKIKSKNLEIILVDDGSTDDSVSIINKHSKRDKRIKLYKNKSNMGASASRNKAIKKSKGEIIIFLDNDTEVKKNWLKNIIKPFDDEKVGGVQSLMFDMEKRELIQNAGGKFMKETAWLLPIYQWQKYSKKIKNKDIVAISASLAVRKKILKKIGGFDDKEAVTTEDLDLSWRIWISGYRIVLAKDSQLHHETKPMHKRENLQTNFRKTYFHLAKNSFRSIIKNYEYKNVLIYLPQSILVNFARGIYIMMKGRSDAMLGFLDAIVWTIENLPDTLKARQKVSSYRKFDDNYLFKKIFAKENLLESISILKK